jgi:hypothetical protein
MTEERRNGFEGVMAGLDPAIHFFCTPKWNQP